MLIKLTQNGKAATVVWRNKQFVNLMGGVIIKDKYIYGSTYRRGGWMCLDWDTGELQYTSTNFGLGAIIFADNLFYCYSEKVELALVDALPQSFNVLSSFPITAGTGQHWAHPVISDGRLFLRHGNSLMVYSIVQ